jgi:hypothetical protein
MTIFDPNEPTPPAPKLTVDDCDDDCDWGGSDPPENIYAGDEYDDEGNEVATGDLVQTADGSYALAPTSADLDGKRRKDGSYGVEALRGELSPVASDPLRRSSVGLSSDERRLRRAFDAPRTPAARDADRNAVRDDLGRDGLAKVTTTAEGITGLEQPDSTKRGTDRSGPARGHLDAAQRFVRENDPLRTLAGVTSSLESAAADRGRSLETYRSAFPKRGGRPSGALLGLRAELRDVLLPIYEDGRRVTLIAEALGCSPQALEGLLGT